MPSCAFLGDEVSAAGFRLAGAEVHTPGNGEAVELFRRLGDAHELVILTAEVAAGLPEELLEQAAQRNRPLVLVIPDAAGRTQPPDLAARMREQLGLNE
jgi:vacuolar-type H+-ATPase subunit F/Vma7